MHKSLTFRAMNKTDLSDVMAIENVNYPNPWPEKTMLSCINAGYQCQIGYHKSDPEVVVCYAVMMIGFEESNLLNISVNPDFKRQSVGVALLHHLLLISRINHAKTMWLEVRASNQAAINLYQRLHFEVIGQRANYYQYRGPTGESITEHAILMSRPVIRPPKQT